MDREEKLKLIADLGGIPEDAFDELFNTSIQEIKDELININNAFATLDIEMIQKSAHTIKGVSINFGLVHVHSASKKLEQILSNNGDNNINAAANDFSFF